MPLIYPVAIEEGMRFAIREKASTQVRWISKNK